MKSKIKGILWILEISRVKSLSGNLDQHPYLNYKINLVLRILKLHKQLEKRNHWVAYIWGTCSKMPSSIRTSLLNYKLPTIHWKVGSPNKHVWMEEASGALHAAESQASKRQQELLKLQKDRKATSNWLLAKWSLSIKSSLQPPNIKSSLKNRKQP